MKTFEDALRYAQAVFGNTNVYESPEETVHGKYHVVFADRQNVEHYEGKQGYKLRATVRYEQKVDIL